MDSASRDRLAAVLTAPGQPLDVREDAAVELAEAGDRRAFETLALLLNYRDETRAGRAATALLRLGDPRTGRAAAALATNPLRVGYALPAIRLLVELRAPEAAAALTTTLRRLLAEGQPGHDRVAVACARGLRTLSAREPLPAAGEEALRAAAEHPVFRGLLDQEAEPADGHTAARSAATRRSGPSSPRRRR
ncbi:adenylosuccinate lyase [Streptomyces sp. NBC_01190]|uniref:adenylosuccinate lyase n=1 Tax=Streptomyces sp. NBC_01190 TaxID=2903767 RepID=UPI003864FAFC|nr:adenylosuccinate lyase [Streptomyces sp. NBC_01190]